MPNTDVPPWLQVTPDYFLNSIRAGAEAGLQRGRLLTEQQNAADRLRLAYDQLGAENQRKDEEIQAKLTLAQQMMAMRQQAHEDQMQMAQDRLNLSQRSAEEIARYRDQMLGLRGQSQQDQYDYRNAMLKAREDALAQGRIHFGPQGEVLQAMPDGTVNVLRDRDPRAASARLSETEKSMLTLDQADLRNVNKQITDLQGRTGLGKLLSGNAIPELTEKRDKILNRILSYEPDEAKREALRKRLLTEGAETTSARPDLPVPFMEGMGALFSPSQWLMPSGGTPTKTEMAQPPSSKEGQMRVQRKSDGKWGWIDASDFDPNKYERPKPKSEPPRVGTRGMSSVEGNFDLMT